MKETDNMDAHDTRKSSLCLNPDGGPALLSEQAVAVRGILTESGFSGSSKKTQTPLIEVSAEALVSLILIAVNLRGHMMSPDAKWLANNSAQIQARKMGVPDDVFKDAVKAIESYGKPIADANPISGMF